MAQVGKGPGSQQRKLRRQQRWLDGAPAFTPFTFTNSFDEGTNGVTITAGNSGSATDHAFDNAGAVAGGTLQYDNTHVAHGLLAGEFATGVTSGVADVIWNQLSIPGLQPQLWFRLYCYFTVNPGIRVLEFAAGSPVTEAASIQITGAGIINGLGNASQTLFSFTQAIPKNQWFRLDGTIIGDPVSGVFTVSRYDNPNSAEATETHTATNVNTAGLLSLVRYGVTFLGGANVTAFWLDEIGLSNTGPLGPVGAQAYPLEGPVRASVRNLASPPRGRVYSNAGVYNQVGPPFKPDSSPVAQGSTSAASSSRNGARLSTRGRIASNKGVSGQLGPPVYPLQHPVAAVVRPLPQRGRITGNPGIAGQLGPPVTPLQHPLQARRPLPPRGRNTGNPGVLGQLGPPVKALEHPVSAATRPLPPRGRSYSRAGLLGQAGPPVTPLQHPAEAVARPLPKRGRTASNPGLYGQLGPAVRALLAPVAAIVRPLARRGRAGPQSPGVLGQLGPAVRALAGPVRARRPLPPRGRIASNPGTFTLIQPPLAPLYPLPGPVRAAVRVLPRRGRSLTAAGTYGQAGPPVTPLRGPVRAAIRVLPPRGRTASRAGTYEQLGPPFYALNHPASAVARPLPRRGRIYSLAGTPEPSGPPVRALQQPVAAAARPSPPRGRIYRQSGTYEGTGPQLTPPQGPVRAAYRFRPPRGRAQGNPGVRGQTGSPVKPLQGPVVVHRYSKPPRGQVTGIVRAQPYQPGPKVYPLQGPVRSRRPLPPRGRTYQTPAFVASAPAGFGYPYKAVLQQARWSATALPARDPSQETQQEWSATALPAS